MRGFPSFFGTTTIELTQGVGVALVPVSLAAPGHPGCPLAPVVWEQVHDVVGAVQGAHFHPVRCDICPRDVPLQAQTQWDILSPNAQWLPALGFPACIRGTSCVRLADLIIVEIGDDLHAETCPASHLGGVNQLAIQAIFGTFPPDVQQNSPNHWQGPSPICRDSCVRCCDMVKANIPCGLPVCV